LIHRRKGRKLKRTASHRRALLSNLSVSLIRSKKIRTTLAKAKELKPFIDRLITKSRRALSDSSHTERVTHLRRVTNRYLRDKGAVKILFDEIAPKVAGRAGGYTRVLKLGRRQGDAAELAIVELVDYNVEKGEQKPGEESAASKSKIARAFVKRKSKKKVEKEQSAQPAES
jgi:large subunit ribosomal protein L17